MSGYRSVIRALRKRVEVSTMQIAEMECSACGIFLAHVQVPGTVFVHGEAWCDNCYEEEAEDEEG